MKYKQEHLNGSTSVTKTVKKCGFTRLKNTLSHLCGHLWNQWGSYLFEKVKEASGWSGNIHRPDPRSLRLQDDLGKQLTLSFLIWTLICGLLPSPLAGSPEAPTTPGRIPDVRSHCIRETLLVKRNSMGSTWLFPLTMAFQNVPNYFVLWKFIQSLKIFIHHDPIFLVNIWQHKLHYHFLIIIYRNRRKLYELHAPEQRNSHVAKQRRYFLQRWLAVAPV